MTTATVTRPRAKAAAPPDGVHRTKTHQYYFNGAGPWPGVTSITKVLDAPALDQLEDGPGRAGGDRQRRAADRGPRGRQGRRGGEVPHDPVDHGDGPRLADPRRIEPILRREPRDDRPARRGGGRRGPRLAQRAGPRARPPAARGRGVPDQRDARLRRDAATSSPSSTARSGCSTGRPGRRSPGPTARCTATTGSSWRPTPTPSSSPGSATRSGTRCRPITRFGIVHVTDGGTRLYEADVTARDWIAFRACLALHAWAKEKAA